MPKPWNKINIPREKLKNLYENQGLSIAQIASKLGYSNGPIHRLLREYHLKIRTISEAKEKFKISKKELRNLYYHQKLSMNEIAKKYNCNHVTIVNRIRKYNLKSRGHLGLTKPIRISKEKFEYLYHTRRLSLDKIAKILHCSEGGLQRKIINFKVKTRPISERACKYKKKDFDGTLEEKAYMIGFRLGDLYVSKKKNVIVVHCSTTKKAQTSLIKNLFYLYGGVDIGRAKRGTIEISAFLNDSFKFLIPKEDNIPEWIIKNNKYFLAFFAGYADAEGCFYFRKSTNGRKRQSASFEIQTQDRQIIHELWLGLNQLDIFSPKPKVSRYGGEIDKRGIKNNKDMWRIGVCQKESLWKMLNFLKPYIRHREKSKVILKAMENIISRNNLPYCRPINLFIPKLN